MSGLPIASPEPLTQPFWDACVDGRLVMPKCVNGHCFFLPEVVCPRCLTVDWEWVETTGRGALYSWSVVHRAPAPEVDVPYILAVVDLDGGWTLMTHLICTDTAALRADLRVVLRTTERRGILLPTFAVEEAPP